MRGLAIVLSALLASASAWSLELGAQSQLQGSVLNAPGMMDGAVKRAGLGLNPAGMSDAEKALVVDAAAAPKGTAAEARKAPPAKGLHVKDVPPPSADPGQPKASFLTKVKEAAVGVANVARGVYKWMVRNPVETAAFVAIPVTFFFGKTAGMIAGTAVYLFLSTRQKQPF